MIYPKFIKKNDTIGIVALSAGVGKKIDEFDESINILHKQGYKTIETDSVRVNGEVANTPSIRAKELDELVTNKDVDMIMCAAGGDVQFETLPYINYKHIKANPKWIMGASDPTNLVFTVTTMLDIATLYGFNAGSYSNNPSKAQNNNLNIIKGNLVSQHSFKQYITFLDEIQGNEVYHDVKYLGSNIKTSGRCIGGCLDCIGKIIGTKYDYVSKFINKYKDDGIIWYLDNFALSAYNTYLTLLQMKYAGYFKYTKAILIGRVAFPSNSDSTLVTDYSKVYKDALKDIPYVYEMDIGHTYPSFTMINGAIINVDIKNGKGKIDFELK